MKKLLSILLTFVLLLGTTVCFAHSHTGTANGTTYHLSNNWREYEENIYYYKTNEGEVFFYMDFSLSDESIKSVRDCEDICNEFYDLLCSDSKISSDMGDINGANVSIKTEKESKKNEIYNGVEYLRFEKKYSARATGFYDTYYYRTTLFTVKNGFLYMMIYETDYKTDNFSDIVNLLNTIHFGKAIDIYVNGKKVQPDTYPEIVADRTLVPIRAIVEELGYEVKWNAEEKAVFISNDEIVLALQIGNYFLAKTDLDTEKIETMKLDVPPVIAEDRTYLPLRAVGEALDCEVIWDGATRTIYINSKLA